uniref:Uncharacterized protein n=1 Tax=viral metagenome TaxID=1070528 RepID=A0A6M3L8M8_9ZZZZ
MSEPFWVGHNNPRFKGVRGGYLQALEIDVPEPEPVIHYQPVPSEELKQLRGMLINTREKLQHHLNYKKGTKYV